MKPRICIVVASEMTVRAFLGPHLRAVARDYELTLVVGSPRADLLERAGVHGALVPIAIERPVAPVRDLAALWSLWRLMRRSRFDIVHSMTPKAGLLAMVAGWLARVPVRVHTFTGQVWATRRGVSRAALRALDTMLARAATFTLADSPSQREFLIREGVAPAAKIAVPGSGSVSGVDATLFRPNLEARRVERRRLGIADTDVLLLFVGRLTVDKGLLDLARAFRTIADRRRDGRLLVVGPDEADLRGAIVAQCGPHADRVHFLDFTDRPEEVMAAADILCLPSYREGFGSVVIEAAACGVPAVASRIYGVVDAVEEGVTGLLHQPRNVDSLTRAILRLVEDGPLRRALGEAARERAERDFSPARLTAAVLDVYSALLKGRARERERVEPEMDARRAAAPAPLPVDAPHARAPQGRYQRFGKRAFDILVAGFALVCLAPLFAAVAILVRATIGSPVLFRQRRPGLNGIPFTLVKFRSMTDRYDTCGRALPDAERLTAVGRMLRATSLDELPELWNVLTGDMSLVGPRPLLMEYLPRYSARQAARHAVKPGMTGMAQVNGRNLSSWDERFELDLHYVEHGSLGLDLRILARTLGQVMARRGIAQPGHATRQEFMGAEGQ